MAPQRVLRFTAWLMFKIFFRRIDLKGDILKTPPERLIILANHQSFLDAFLVGYFLPFQITWIVHSTIASRWYFAWYLKYIPHLVVDTASPMAMKSIARLIESGKPVCIFPEGRVTVTGSLMKVYDGLAFLQFRTGASLLPINIDGAVYSKVSRMHAPFPVKSRADVTLTYFPLIHALPVPEGRTGRERRRAASDSIRRLLEENWFRARPVTTLFEALLDAIDLYGRKATILEDITLKEYTYGGLLRGALALGRLVSRFTKEGEIVGVMMPNVSPTMMLLYGMFAMRRVPAMINYTSGVEAMENACHVAKIQTVITSRAFLEKAKLVEKAAQLRKVRIVYLEDLRPQFSFLDKVWLIARAMRSPRSVMRPTQPQDPAIVLFTSGSEGKPKGVVLSHASILANVAQIRAIIEFSNREKFLVALPLFHSFGLVAAALLAITSGSRLFLYPSPLHYRMIPDVAYDRSCTVLFGTGTFLANYARMAHPYDFYNIRYVISGAERLPDSVRETWHTKFGIRILEGYGTTEFSPVLAVNTPLFHRPGTVGRLLPGIEHRLEPVEGIEHGAKLHVRGPNQMLGYLLNDQPGEIRQPESSAGPGWYDTGDVVSIEDGFVRIVGRVKRFAKVAGEMVSLEVVEQIATSVSPSKAHAATAVANERRGESIILYTEDPQLRRDQLQSAAREGGRPEVAIPRTVVYIEKLPRLGNGKPDYVTLKEMAAVAAARPVA